MARRPGHEGRSMESAGTEPPPARRRIGFSEIPRKVRGIVFANVLGGVGFGYLFVFIGAYLPQIGVGAEVVGLLCGAQGVSMVLSAIPLGLYSDRRGRKRLLLPASLILPPSVLVFAFTTDLRWLVLAAVVSGIGEGAFLSTWNAIIADQTTVEQRNAAFSLSFILNNVAGGAGFALPLAFPALQAATGIDSHTIHIGALVVTDAFGFLMPIAFYLLLRGYRESVRPREARPKTMDWRPLLKFSGINGSTASGAGFSSPSAPPGCCPRSPARTP